MILPHIFSGITDILYHISRLYVMSLDILTDIADTHSIFSEYVILPYIYTGSPTDNTASLESM